MTRNLTISIALIFALVNCNQNSSGTEVKAAAAPLAESQATAPSSPSLPAGHPPVGQGPMQGPMQHPPQPPAAVQGGPPHAGGLTWRASKPLESRPPASAMRAAEYRVAGDTPEQEGVLTIYFFGAGQGGSVQDNLNRWIGQFTQPDGKPSQDAASISKLAAGAVPITKLDLRGTYSGGMAPMMGQPATPMEGQRLLGAIAEGPQGPVFFKLIGPESTLTRAEAAFDELLRSIAPQ